MRIILCKGQIYGPISGSDETLVTYATQLLNAGHTVSVLLMYLHAEEDQYYQRLLDAGVPVSWIASNLAHTSMGAGRKLAYKMFHTFPGSRQFIRRKAQRVVTRMATRYYRQCLEFFEKHGADLIHVMTPDPAAMVMIRAGHAAKGGPRARRMIGLNRGSRWLWCRCRPSRPWPMVAPLQARLRTFQPLASDRSAA